MCLLEAESPLVPYETSRQTPSLFFPQPGRVCPNAAPRAFGPRPSGVLVSLTPDLGLQWPKASLCTKPFCGPSLKRLRDSLV